MLSGRGPAEASTATADLAMARHARGEAGAFEAVFDAIGPRVHAYLRRHVPEPGQAEDLLQQTFLQMHRARGTFIEGAQVLPWAFAIARRLLIDSSRRDRRFRLVAGEPDGLLEIPDPQPGQLAALQARETAERMTAAFRRLPESQRTAFEMVKRDGLTFKQAAEMLGTTIPAVKLRAQRAYDALRAAASGAQVQ